MTIDDITSKVRKISKETVAEVQKMNEVRQLNSSINAEKKKIHSMYTEIGKKLYDQYRENPPEEFVSEFRAIKEEFEAIEVLRGQIRAKKGVTLCPNCKMEVGEFESFCSNCGCKMPVTLAIEEDEAAEAPETVEGKAQTSEDSSTPEADAVKEPEKMEAEAVEAETEAAESESEATEEPTESETEAVKEAPESEETRAEVPEEDGSEMEIASEKTETKETLDEVEASADTVLKEGETDDAVGGIPGEAR
ncbi:MAG: hypothetical protein LUD18_05955 [Lachnospiraceae bacterium]|nr:hypothetical protein [Lachnospiraceae bacterium]